MSVLESGIRHMDAVYHTNCESSIDREFTQDGAASSVSFGKIMDRNNTTKLSVSNCYVAVLYCALVNHFLRFNCPIFSTAFFTSARSTALL